MTSNREFNLHVRANERSPVTSVAVVVPHTIAGPMFIGEFEDPTVEEV